MKATLTSRPVGPAARHGDPARHRPARPQTPPPEGVTRSSDTTSEVPVSPRVIAQRRQLEAAFGSVMERQGAPVRTLRVGGRASPVQRTGPGVVVQRVMDYEALLAFVMEHPPGDIRDPYGYIGINWDALEAAGYESTEGEIKLLGHALDNVRAAPPAAAPARADVRKEGMTETDAREIADARGWTLVEKWDYDKRADTSHRPKGKVYTDGERFFSADNTGHVGFGFKRFSGSAKSLSYEGNVSANDPDTLIQRGAQRTEKKKRQGKQEKE